ncbi:hypothetical protein Tco_1242651 [Tanacetum coccineum]
MPPRTDKLQPRTDKLLHILTCQNCHVAGCHWTATATCQQGGSRGCYVPTMWQVNGSGLEQDSNSGRTGETLRGEPCPAELEQREQTHLEGQPIVLHLLTQLQLLLFDVD